MKNNHIRGKYAQFVQELKKELEALKTKDTQKPLFEPKVIDFYFTLGMFR
eukprot:CAMPEP_0170499292 /NCGR_PEP_ID=MMETSP0208-20121228/30893_1 /TAXON_ID=197538 /ORGANISM="Strombidium inclinatum, Strain S3" /LENGTH=49 /DNA_ID=CAMNT_0010776797 /DNA_START=91 /DNA_END=240 /DNA_ORIENTATION=+